MARQDIILNDDSTRKVQNGDYLIGDSDQQHSAKILDAFPGEIRLNPSLGFGARGWLKKTIRSVAEIETAIKREHAKDGYDQIEVSFSEGKVTVDL